MFSAALYYAPASKTGFIKIALMLIVVGFVFIALPQQVHAGPDVDVNDNNIYDRHRMHAYSGSRKNMRTCDFENDGSAHGATTSSWVSLRDKPTQGEDFPLVSHNQNTVNLQVNYVGHYCTSNMTPSDTYSGSYPYGSAELIQQHIFTTRANIGDGSGSSTRAGAPYISNNPRGELELNSGFGGEDLLLRWKNCFESGHIYIVTGTDCNGVPIKANFSLSGFNDLPAGLHTVTVVVPMQHTHQDEALDWRCIKNPSIRSEDGTGCPIYNAEFHLQFEVEDEPTHWNYTVGLDSDLPNTARPGDSVTLTSTVENDGDGEGEEYDHRFAVDTGSGYGTIHTYEEGELDPDDDRENTRNYTIPDDLPHGREVCFRARVTPYSGQSTPTKTITSSGWRNSTVRCLTVRRTFNLTPSLSGSGFTDGASIENGSNVALNLSITNVDNQVHRGNTRPIYGSDVQSRIYVSQGSQHVHDPDSKSRSFSNITRGDTVTWSGSFTLEDDMPRGTTICFRGGVTPNSSSTTTEQLTGEICIVTTYDLVPQLRAYGNDVHAGGGTVADNTDPHSCALPNGSGDNTGEIAFESSVNNQRAEHFGQFLVSAFGSITNFGSNATRPGVTPGSTVLMLRNDPNDGGYNPTPNNICRFNIDNLTPGGALNTDIEAELVEDGVAIEEFNGANFNLDTEIGGLSGPGSYLFYSTSSSTVRIRGNSGTVVIPDGYKITVLSQTGVRIETNIVYDNSYNNREDIPAFGIVAPGSIETDESVTEVTGILYSKERIITCPTSISLNNKSGIEECDDPIQYTGSLNTGIPELRRTTDPEENMLTFSGLTFGSLTFSSQVHFSPEFYLSVPPLIQQLSETPYSTSQLQLQSERPPLL